MNRSIARLRPGRRARAIAGIAVVALVSGLVALAAAPTGARAAENDSSVTVKWRGGNTAEIQRYQPDHAALTSDGQGNDAGSGHWDDFKDLEVTVSRTKGLKDGSISITATGMAPLRMMDNGGTVVPGTPSNFLQLMQCWGPDPSLASFPETCQFGAYDANNGKAADAASLFFAHSGFYSRPSAAGIFTKFRAATGEFSKPVGIRNPQGEVIAERTGTEVFFGPTTTNEQVFVPIAKAGPTSQRFEVQSAAAAPHLGCGAAPPAGSDRCWLVAVPFGEHSNAPKGADAKSCSSSLWQPYGAKTPFQMSSTLDPTCTSWQDRIVIPLDFADVFARCAPGSVERRVVGSELAASALASWQSTLCNRNGGAAYSLTTNSGNLVRSQLLTGLADFAFVSDPLAEESIGAADPALLDTADLAYAPVVNTALVIGVTLVSKDGNSLSESVKLTPRLLAKALTQSYGTQIPSRAGGGAEAAHALGRPRGMIEDPEWTELGNPVPSQMGATFGFLLLGPSGDDAIRLLWRYIQADAQAAAFLRGEADPWGMKVNPYYLQSGRPGALGGGLSADLSRDSLDTLPLSDQTVTDHGLDSVTLRPYSRTLHEVGQGVFRAAGGPWRSWDPQANNGVGAYSATPQSRAGDAFTSGPVDLATASSFGIGTARLQLPNSSTFVGPTDASLTAAMARMKVVGGIASVDYGKLDGDGYPLTITVNAAVDLNSAKLTPSARTDYAGLLRYAATDGNVLGESRGQLPEGYVPLTPDQTARTLALADRLLDTVGSPGDGSSTPSTPSGGAAKTSSEQVPSVGSVSPATQTSATRPITASQTSAIGPQGALGAVLVAGVAGLVVAPFLLRRRRTG